MGQGNQVDQYTCYQNVGQNQGLRIISCNIRSIYKNKTELEVLNFKTKADVIALQETWEREIEPITLQGMNLIANTKRVKSRAGGTAIFANPELNIIELGELHYIKEKELEMCGTLIDRRNRKNIIIINIYLGFTNRENMVNIIMDKIRWARSKHRHAELMLMGDFNMNFFDIQNNEILDTLTTNLQTQLLTPHITVATRVEQSGINTSATCIDNIFSSNKIPCKAKVLVDKISDHYPIIFDLEGKKKPSTITISYRSRKQENIELVEKLCLQTTFLKPNTRYLDVNTLTEEVQEKLNTIIDLACPLQHKTIKSNSIKPEWLTSGFEKSIKTKSKLASKAKNGNLQTQLKYKKYLAAYNKIRRAAEQNCLKQKISDAGKNIKAQWRLINELTNRTKNVNKIPLVMQTETGNTSNTQEVADLFNKYFSTVGEKLASCFPDTDKWKDTVKPRNSSFELKTVLVRDVAEVIKSLKNKNSHGWDLMTNHLLKQLAYILNPVLTKIVNLSILQGKYPDSFKTTRVIPLYKAGSKQEVKNYRPISLSPILSKVLERIVCGQTRKYLEKEKIIPDTQYGFRPGHQINHLLQNLVNEVMANKNKKLKSAAIFLDFSKAFDTLSYRILLGKMKLLGFGHSAMSWYGDYLSNRFQYTEINGVLSQKEPITLGVPQGTVLGPLLYLIYTHDLPNATILKALLFADDTSLIASGKTDIELHTTLQHEMDILSEWFVHNKLTLNISKSKLMNFYNADAGNISVRNNVLESVQSFKLVGVIITSKLTWDEHAARVAQKIKPACYYLNKLKYKLDIPNKTLIYHSLVNSHIGYALPIWQGMSQKASNRITTKQNQAIRAIYNLNYRESTTEIARTNSILNLNQTMCYTSLLLAKSTRQLYNPHLAALFPSKEAGNLRSASRNLFNIPKTTTTNAQKQSSYITPSLWNSHDEDIKALAYPAFREATKQLLLKNVS